MHLWNRVIRFLAKTDDYSSNNFKLDLFAGITVALVLIPQSIALADLAGLPPQYGLYAALLPPVVAALFGSSKLVSTGPMAILSLLTATAIASAGITTTDEKIGFVLLAAFLLGVLQFTLGKLRLGMVIHLLSHPVVFGFTNSAVILIGFSQLPNFFGITIDSSGYFYESVFRFGKQIIYGFNFFSVVMGFLTLILVYSIRSINQKLPVILITVSITTFISWLTGYHQLANVMGEVPMGLPSFSIPSFSMTEVLSLLPVVLTMAVVGFTETISIAQAIAAKTKQRIDPDKELIGQGLANITAAFTSGYPVTGSISRSAINVQSGAQSPLSTIWTSVIILVTVLFLTPLLFYVPQVVLAVIILVTIRSLIDLKHFFHIWKINKSDGVAAILTCVVTLLYAPRLELGLIAGLTFSMGYYIFTTMRPRIAILSLYKDGTYHDARTFYLEECQNIAVIRFDAPLFFANAEYLQEEIIAELAAKKHLEHILLVGDGITQIDTTGAKKVREIVELLQEGGKDLYFAGLLSPVEVVLERAGLFENVNKKHLFSSVKEGVDYLVKHTKHHTDKKNCPLLKYIKLPSEHHQHPSLAENIHYFFHKIYSRVLPS